jgi:acyl carrier protein
LDNQSTLAQRWVLRFPGISTPANFHQNFFDAFADYRNAHGLPTVSISLPVVLDVGFVADRGLTETLKSSLKAIISEPQLKTLVKGAILGPASGLNYDGKAISFSLASGDDLSAPAWQRFHPRALVQRINSDKRDLNSNDPGQGGDTRSTGDVSLLDALITRVSSITMIERDDVEADAPLSAYSLDSLVSVELRNWIRRETGVELALPAIARAGTLRALSAHILSQKDANQGSK